MDDPTTTSDSPRLREATAADAPVLTRLRVVLFEELGSGVDAERTAAFVLACERMLAEAFAEGRAWAWVFEDAAGLPVATATLLMYSRVPTPADLRSIEGYLLGVYTAPAWRRRGLGKELLGTVIERARQLGLARLRLHATEAGGPLYEALGFKGKPNAMELRLD